MLGENGEKLFKNNEVRKAFLSMTKSSETIKQKIRDMHA